VDETALIIVAAELTNMAADNGELPAMLDAVRANLDADASQVLADAGYRSERCSSNSKIIPPSWSSHWGARARRKSRSTWWTRTLARRPWPPEQGKGAYRKRESIAEPPNGWIKTCWGFGSSA